MKKSTLIATTSALIAALVFCPNVMAQQSDGNSAFARGDVKKAKGKAAIDGHVGQYILTPGNIKTKATRLFAPNKTSH